MIHIRNDFNNPPEKLLSENCQKLIERSLIEKKKQSSSNNYYGDPNVVNQLRKLSQDKCSYCEVLSHGGFHVDHYRPLSSVKMIPTHKGYYWLSCEWSNLIFSCNACNIKKSNQFPIENEFLRVNEPSGDWRADSAQYKMEMPLIIHPQMDHPSEHMTFLPNGMVRDLTKKGQYTIDVCGLNRKDLINKRLKAINEIINLLYSQIKMFIEKEYDGKQLRTALCVVFSLLDRRSSSENEFSRLHWIFQAEFEIFIKDFIPETKALQLVIDAFRWFSVKKSKKIQLKSMFE